MKNQKIKFTNVENQKHTSMETKEVIYKSRSVAVATRFRVPNYMGGGPFYHLILKRGESVSDSGKWCFPCGYLDYGETTVQAAQRELYEESGLFIDLVKFFRWKVSDDPDKELQNVTFHFDVLGENTMLDTYKEVIRYHVTKHLDDGEVTDFAFAKSPNNFDMAFNHENYFVT